MIKKYALSRINLVKKYTKRKLKSFEEFASEAIMSDICDRGHLKNIMYQIKEDDAALFRDIKKTWAYIIGESLKIYDEELKK